MNVFHIRPLSSAIICTLLILFYSLGSAQATSVSGSYLKGNGKHISLFIQVDGAKGQSLIVEQHIRGQNRILSGNPSPVKISKNGKSAKWLFRGFRGGSTTIDINLAKPASGDALTAVVRFRSANGTMKEIHIRP